MQHADEHKRASFTSWIGFIVAAAGSAIGLGSLWKFPYVTASVILKGVVKGIEQVSKIMLPGLFILILIIAIYSMTLKGAWQGLKFLFVPDFSVNSLKNLSRVINAALGQVFFSLSLGLGITITYGSYLKAETDLIKIHFLLQCLMH